MTTSTIPDAEIPDAEILAAVEGPPSLRPRPTDPLRGAIARQMHGEPVDDLLDLSRQLLVNVLRQRDGHSADSAARTVAACERAIRAEMSSPSE